MKSIKCFAKRSLSLILCLAMVMTTMFFFDIGITKPEAAVSTNNSTTQADVLFHVPEAIYLRPVSYSWGANSKSKFHFFVENTVLDGSGNLMSQPTAKADITNGNGKVYFKYANGTYKGLEIRWLTNDLLTEYTDGGALIFGSSGGSESAAGGLWAEISRDMESPTLAAGTNGCVLEWKLNYHDNADNLDKSIVAYTYVYKPYVVQISSGVKTKETFYDDHEIQFISWVSGIHHVVSEATWNQRYARYGASARTGNKGFLPFLTPGNLDGINGSGEVGSTFGVKDSASLTSGAKTLNAYFASSNTSYDYFYADQSANTNNQNAWDWHVDSGAQSMSTTESSNSSLNKAVHVYSDIERDPGGTDDACVWKSFVNNSLGGIYIDTSRYKDLSQVPNLGVGLRITKAEGTGEDGSWYVGDYTGRTPAQDDYYGSNQDATWNNYFETIWTDVNYSIAGAGNKQTTVSHGSWCETKYAGTWARTLTKNSNGTYAAEATYKTRSTVYTHRGEDATIASTIMQLKAFQYDKTNLRTAVYNATKEFARLGIYDNNFNSHYYNNSGAYTAFINAYKDAYTSLIYVDMAPTANPDTLATNLNNALNALKSDTASRKTGTARQYNIGLVKKPDGTYRAVAIPNTQTHTQTYLLRNKVEFTADTYSNFTFKGAVKVTGNSVINIAELTKESNPITGLEFASADNRQDYTVTHSGNTVFAGTSTMATSMGPATFAENNSKITIPYASDADITFIYYYELNGEALFGNEFIFDQWTWNPSTNAEISFSIESIDYINNTISFKTGNADSEGKYDGYTVNYEAKTQPGIMTLVPGVTYEYSATFKNNSDKEMDASMFFFMFTAKDSEDTSKNDYIVAANSDNMVPAGGTKTVSRCITIPDTYPYATIRVGTHTPNVEFTVSDIAVRNVSSKNNLAEADTRISKATPLFKTPVSGTSVTGFPTIVMPGYGLAGWSEARNDSGFGVGPAITSVNVAPGEYKVLHPIWGTTPITYNIKFISEETGETKTQTGLAYDGEHKLAKNSFEYAKHAFDYWLDKSTGKKYEDEAVVKNLGINDGDVVELHAVWKPGPELMFGNEFNFDEVFKENNNANGVTVDFLNDTIEKAIAPGDSDTYTREFIFKVDADRVYMMSYRYDPMGTLSEGQYHVWMSDDDEVKSDEAGTVYYGGQPSRKGTTSVTNAAHTFKGIIGEPYVGSSNKEAVVWPEDTNGDGYLYMKIRFDFDRPKNVDSTLELKGKYSDIYIVDVTDDTTTSVPKPIQITGTPGQVITKDQFPTVTRKGYTSIGWSTTKDSVGNGVENQKLESVTLNEDGTNKTIYAIWRPNVYTVRFDPNPTEGDTVQVEGSQPDMQIAYNEIESVPVELGYTYDGYKFFGWNTNKDGTGKYYRAGDILENLTDVDGGVVTLYAIWKYDSEVLFGNWLYFDDFYTYVEQQSNITIDVETNSMTVVAKLGGQGTGSGSAGSETYINDFGPFEDKFEPGKRYAMTYDFEIIEGTINPKKELDYEPTKYAGTQIHLWFGDMSKAEDDDRYKFQGANVFQEGLYEPNPSSTPIAPGGKTEVRHEFTMPKDPLEKPDLKIRLDIDLYSDEDYACTEVTVKISNVYFYCLNNPAGFADDICLPHDKTTGKKLVEITGKPRTFVSADQFPKQERTGYEFLGWSRNHIGDGNGDPYSIITTGVELPSGDERCVLYSVWKAIDYTVKYDPNGGKITSGTGFADKPTSYDEEFRIPANNDIYVRDNAIFTGWNTKDDGSGTAYADGAVAKNITSKEGYGYLYAQWKALPEVIYGNLFDFDKYLWEVPKNPDGTGGGAPYYMDIKVDKVSNTLTMRTDKNVGTGDCYTNIYHASNQTGAMPIVPGRTYEFSFAYKNNSAKEAPIRAILFESRDTTVSRPNSYDHVVTAAASGTEGSEGTYRATFTAGEEQHLLTLRFGVEGRPAELVMNLDVEISDIVIRDITDYSDDLAISAISGITRFSDKLPSVDGKNMYVTNYIFGAEPNLKFDDLEREHYTFLGWSTVLDLETGNGVLKDDNGTNCKVTSYKFNDADAANVTLYPIWAGNVVLVSFKPELKAHLFDNITKLFEYGKADTAAEVVNPRFTIEYFDGGELPVVTEFVDAKLVSWDSRDGKFSYTVDPEKGCLIRDPNEIYGHSNVNDENTRATELVGKWTNGGDFTPATLILKKDAKTNKPTHVLKGWTTIPGGVDVEFKVGAPIAASKDMQLHAIWLEIAAQDTSFDNIEATYQEKAEIVTGVTIQADGSAKENVSDKHYIYNREDIDKKLDEYEAAKDAFVNGTQSAESNNALLDSIAGVNNVGPAKDSDKNGLVLDYLKEFEILYADDVDPADMSVDPGKYQVKNMNLNHYSRASLEAAKEALLNTEGFSADQVSREKQTIINNSVITLAKTYANKEDVQPSTPMYNVYDTVETMQGSGLIQSDDLTSVNYVYTGKGNYTYYCYTSSKNPTILITVDDLKTSENRYCYPTKAETIGIPTAVKGAKTETPVPAVTTDTAAANAYETMYAEYFALNMGVGVDETLGKDYYSQKAVIELKPDFTEVASNTHNATVSYKFMAHDDAFAGVDGINKNYADAAKLASGEESGTLNEIPDTGVTGENMFTIIVDYHEGDEFDVDGMDVETDKWINQYHLSRTSGGASNWELPMPDDKIYTVNDQTYGQSNYGSFTYTFRMGDVTDLANCVLNIDTTTGVETPEAAAQVVAIIKDNYNEIVEQKFDAAQEIWKWATDPADGVWKYMCTHEAGTGLGYKAWPNTTWSFNYYPASLVFTYVHLVDRWGNTVDKIIRTPKIDGSATQLHTNSVGTVDVIELGGSGIGTMSLSTQTFDIITDENSVFDGETFTTTGNTIKVYTGEANKKYTLEANDIATNKTTADVTTNADGYLTITVEDKAFDKESGMYTFSLNGTEINLYGEVATEPEEPDVPVIPERGVTNVEYTPSVDTRNEFMFTVIGRPDKIQVIEPDGGTRTYDRYHVKVVIVSYDAEGNVVGAMSRELSYEVWTIEMNVPAEKELTAIARYGREWSKEAPYKYTVILAEPIFDDEVYSMALERTEGKQGKVLATVVTGLDVQGVRFLMDNNTTTTYYLSTEADGKLTYVGNAWINHSGENIIIVKIRVNNAWINAGELNYNAI